MKKISILFSLILLLVGFYACSNTKTYSELQDEEQALIKDYIKRNNITVVTTMPKLGEWGDKVYYKSATGLYFHLISPKSVADTINVSDDDKVKLKYKISYRFRNYSLSLPSDTLSNWSTVDYAYPNVLIYGNSSSGSVGLQEAVKYMRFLNSEAKVIIPHNISESGYLNSVTPRGYDLRITAIN